MSLWHFHRDIRQGVKSLKVTIWWINMCEIPYQSIWNNIFRIQIIHFSKLLYFLQIYSLRNIGNQLSFLEKWIVINIQCIWILKTLKIIQIKNLHHILMKPAVFCHFRNQINSSIQSKRWKIIKILYTTYRITITTISQHNNHHLASLIKIALNNTAPMTLALTKVNKRLNQISLWYLGCNHQLILLIYQVYLKQSWTR